MHEVHVREKDLAVIIIWDQEFGSVVWVESKKVRGTSTE